MIDKRKAIYDEQIAPLMQQISEIAQANGISFICQFQVDQDGANYHINLLPDAHREMRNQVQWLVQNGLL